jgi:hypothetical protein
MVGLAALRWYNTRPRLQKRVQPVLLSEDTPHHAAYSSRILVDSHLSDAREADSRTSALVRHLYCY